MFTDGSCQDSKARYVCGRAGSALAGHPFLFQGFHIRSVEEIEKLQSLCRSAILGNVFDDVTSGRMIDLVTLKRVVSDTVDGVLRNPDAHVSLTQLKEWDNYTRQHSINVCILALAFARHLGLPRYEMEMLGAGALLHDIGKLKTRLDVLNKPGKLTPDEFKIMQSHPVHAGIQIQSCTHSNGWAW